MSDFDVAVVGGGIVGLAFAWEAARRVRTVAVFERDAHARGATVRNFGMVWPIGQRPGTDYERALRSVARWHELAAGAGLWLEPCGSLHVARHPLEAQVLREFAALAPAAGVACAWLDASEVAALFPMVTGDGLLGGIVSPAECAVEPRAVPGQVRDFLAARFGVSFFPETTVIDVSPPAVTAAGGRSWRAREVFVCSGSDFSTLFPAEYAASGLSRCKLQMLATRPQPAGRRVGAHLAGGLTLAHYRAFEGCPSLPELKAHLAAAYPEHLRYGIHVMAAQNQFGEVVVGDSHESGDDVTPFDAARVEELILEYLDAMVTLPDRRIARRWSGVYARHPAGGPFAFEPRPGCHVVSGFGGAGMTLAFGYAADWWDTHDGAVS